MDRVWDMAGWIVAGWRCETCRLYRRLMLAMAVLLAASVVLL